MDLFNNDPLANRLPYDGEMIYYGPIMPIQKAHFYFQQLLREIPWKHDEAILFGKKIVTARKVAWYGDETYSYQYSGVTRVALKWTPILLQLKNMITAQSGHQFNSCLLNLYHDGSEGMSWHSDDEASLGKDTVIASLSFGAERKFSVKHKTSKQSLSLQLEQGSLLLMKGSMQTHWLHSIPKTKKVNGPRINLTFRSIQS